MDIEVSVASKDCEEGTLYNVMCKKEGCGNYTIQYRDTRYAGKDHVYDEGVVVVKPTYETLGKLKRTCTECGSTTMEDIDVLERTDLGDLELELSDYAYTYDGKEKKPSVKLLDDDGKAISSRFYTVSYKNNKNPGDNTASVIVRPKSDAYCGSATATFTIAQVKLSTSAVTVGGKARLTLKGIASVEDYEVSKRKIITWDRKKGTITGKKLGKVKLTIYGYDKEDNEVTVSVTISVVPKATSISKVKSKAKKQAVVTWKTNKTGGGYQIQYSMDKNFKKGVKTLKVTSNSKKSAVIRSLKRKKTYYFRIRTINAKSASLVSAWSKVKKVKIK
ncbi:MAG: fibronectin type III domain-containing protein [Lachnospiraceae bacterium]